MERLRRVDVLPASTIDMFEQVTHIIGFHQLADVCRLDGNDKLAGIFRGLAVRKGRRVLTLAETSTSNKQAFERTIKWLKGTDYEMHKAVKGSLDTAQAIIDASRNSKELMEEK